MESRPSSPTSSQSPPNHSPNSPPHSLHSPPTLGRRKKVKAKCKSAYIACKLQLNKSLSHPHGTKFNSEEDTPLRKTLSEPNTPGAESKKNYFCHFKDKIVDKTREFRHKECISKMTSPNYEEVDAELLKLMRKPSISPFAEKRKSVLEGRRPVSGPPKFHSMEYEEDGQSHEHSGHSPHLRRSQSARRPSPTLFQTYTASASPPSTHMQIQNPYPQLQSSHSPRRSSASLFQHITPFQHTLTSSQEQYYPPLIQNNTSFQTTSISSKERRSSPSLLRNTEFTDGQLDSRSSPSLLVNSSPLKDRTASTNRSTHLQRSQSEKRFEKPTLFQNYRPGQLYPTTENTDGNTPPHQHQLSRRSTPSLFYNFKPFPPSETPSENQGIGQMTNPLIPSKAPDYPINQMTNNYGIEDIKMEEMYCPINTEDSPNTIRRKGAVKSESKTSYEIEKYVVETMKELKQGSENRNNWDKAVKKSMMISRDPKEIKLERENFYVQNVLIGQMEHPKGSPGNNLNPRENWEKAFRKSICNDAMLATVKIFEANSLLPPPPGVYCVAKYRHTSKHIDEISLERGDIISPSHQLEPGWWYGTMVLPIPTQSRAGTNNIKGVFPANYVNCFIDLYKMN